MRAAAGAIAVTTRSIPARKPGQVWKMKDDKPGIFLIVGPGNTSYSDGAWTILVLETQAGRSEKDRVRVFDDVWFSLGFAELYAF